MNLILLAVLIGAGIAVGSRWTRRRAQERAYDLGYKEGVKRGFEQVPIVMKQILGQKRFKEITKEILSAVDKS